MWFSIGFGINMNNTDMIAWHADGANSRVTDYHSVSKGTPEADEQQDLDYYFNLVDADENDPSDYPKVHFLVYRDLDTGDELKDFLLEINTEVDMVYAFYLSSATWYEHSTRGLWQMDFNDGLGTLNDIEETDAIPNIAMLPEIKVGIDIEGKVTRSRTPIEELDCQE